KAVGTSDRGGGWHRHSRVAQAAGWPENGRMRGSRAGAEPHGHGIVIRLDDRLRLPHSDLLPKHPIDASR
ncbi:hypothetical protein D9B85_14440, partial [Corynebacterium diphtheriae]